MDIDEDGVTDPTTEFGDLFEGQTVAFENELVGHDADDVLGVITHDLGITSSTHHRSTHHPSDHDILAANLNFVPDDYLQGQQIVMDHETSEYMGLSEVSGVDGQQHLHSHQQPLEVTGGANQQIFLHSNQHIDQQIHTDANSGATMYEYNYSQVQMQQEVVQTSNNNYHSATLVQEEPKVKRKVKVVKDVKYFTHENMERYLKHRGFKLIEGGDKSKKSISKAVFALTAESQISKDHSKLVSFGSKYEPEFVVQEIERFWKFYLSTKSRSHVLSIEFLPMLIPMLLNFFFEMMMSHMFPIARRLINEFSKKFVQEDKTQVHYDILVAVTKINSLEMLKSDSLLGPLIHRRCEFYVSELALCHLRQFLSKTTQPILVHLFTNKFKIRTLESKDLIQRFEWDNLNSGSEQSSDSSDEEYDAEILAKREYVTRVIEDLRNSTMANLPAVSVYTTGDNPICGNVSKKGSMIAFGLAEAGIRVCTVEKARDVTILPNINLRPADPEKFYGIKSIGGHAGTVYGVHFHPRTKLLFSVGQDSLMRAWDFNTDEFRCRVIYRGHSGPIWRLDIPESGALVATAGLDTTARIFVPERTDFVRIMAGHYSSVNAVKFHPNEAYIATGSADKSVRLWSVDDGNIVRMFTGSAGSVNCLAFHESGKYLAGAGEDSKILIWDLAQGEVLASLDSLSNCRDLEFKGYMLSACFRNGMLQVFNLRRIFGSCLNDDKFYDKPLPSISEPFTTQCFARTLFKVQYMASNKLFCLGSDMSIDVDENHTRDTVKALIDANTTSNNEPTAQDEDPGETILQQVLQAGHLPLIAHVDKQDIGNGSKKKGGIVTVLGPDGTNRILAARLLQLPPSASSPITAEHMDTDVELSSDTATSVPENTQIIETTSLPTETSMSTSSAINATPTQQMITSAELDAAIASVIDQSGGDNNTDSGGTITMYASS